MGQKEGRSPSGTEGDSWGNIGGPLLCPPPHFLRAGSPAVWRPPRSWGRRTRLAFFGFCALRPLLGALLLQGEAENFPKGLIWLIIGYFPLGAPVRPVGRQGARASVPDMRRPRNPAPGGADPGSEVLVEPPEAPGAGACWDWALLGGGLGLPRLRSTSTTRHRRRGARQRGCTRCTPGRDGRHQARAWPPQRAPGSRDSLGHK